MNQYNFDITVGANTYAGELAAPYVTAALLGAETIAKSRARLIEGVTRKAVVNTITSANPIIAASCTPSEGSNVTLGEQVATLSDLQVYESICRKTIFPTWVAAQGKMKRNGDIPPEFTDFLLSVVASKAGEQLESFLWAGDSGAVFGLGFLSDDGVIDEAGITASACTSFLKADTGGTAWSKGNILDAFGLVYDKAMEKPAIANKPGFGFYCSYEAYGFYLQALATSGSNQGINLLGTNQAFNTVTYMGYPVYPTSGIPNTVDVMVATYPDNLVIATNNFTGNTQAELIPRYKYDGKDSVIVTMNFAVGLNVAVPTDGVVGFNFA